MAKNKRKHYSSSLLFLGPLLILMLADLACRNPMKAAELSDEKNFSSTDAFQNSPNLDLDLSDFKGNFRLAITNMNAQKNTDKNINFSTIKISQNSMTIQSLLSKTKNIDINALSYGRTANISEALLPPGPYQQLNIRWTVGESKKIHSAALALPKMSIVFGESYILVLGVQNNKFFIRYFAQFKEAKINHVIFDDYDGIKSSHLPFADAIMPAMPSGSPLHRPKLCGNETIDRREQCDDGNRVSNDGCSARCQFEGNFPLCRWSCSGTECPVICDPVCEPPRCGTECQALVNPPNCLCDIACEVPVCEIKCPDTGCELQGCPQCETLCEPPVCVSHCAIIDPQGPGCLVPPPLCESRCDPIKCDWKCHYPPCPPPECALECDQVQISGC